MASQTFTTAGTHQWQAPPGVTEVFVELIGGGGAGGGATGNPATGGGGAGGAFASATVSVTPGNTYNVVVANQVAGTQAAGSQGNSSTFNATSVVAAGGPGGALAADNNEAAAGGTGTTSGSTGTTLFAGGNGSTGVVTSGSGFSGAGGGGAGPSGNGGNASGATGGTGIDTGISGNGANGVGNSTNGGIGAQAGGGGSGGKANNNTNRNGGAGAAGWARLTWEAIVEMSEAPTASDPLAFGVEFSFLGELASALDAVTATVVGDAIELSVAEAGAAADTVLANFGGAIAETATGADTDGFSIWFTPPGEAVTAVDTVTVLINDQDIGFSLSESNTGFDTALFGIDIEFPDETAVAADTIAYEVRGNTSLLVVEDAAAADTVTVEIEGPVGVADAAVAGDGAGILVELNPSVSEAPAAADTVTAGVQGTLPAIAVAAVAADTIVFRYRTFLQPAPHEIVPVDDAVVLGRATSITITENVAVAVTTTPFILRPETADEESAVAGDTVTLDVTTTTAPDAPGNLHTTFVNHEQINLAWDASTGTPATTYELQFSLGGAGSWSTLVNDLVLSFSHTGRAAATTYDYRVRAHNTAGASSFTELLGVTTDSAPGAITGGSGFIKRGFTTRGSGRVLAQPVGVQRTTIVEPGQTDQAYPTEGGI